MPGIEQDRVGVGAAGIESKEKGHEVTPCDRTVPRRRSIGHEAEVAGGEQAANEIAQPEIHAEQPLEYHRQKGHRRYHGYNPEKHDSRHQT